jgi:hypothetical protein
MMTADQARRQAGSPARAAALSKRYAKLGSKAIDEQEFGKAYTFLQKASAFAAALGIVQSEFNRMAKRIGAPTRPFAKCSNCKARKPDVKKRIDPYKEDVDNKKVYRNLCDGCEKSIKEGI